MQTFLLITLTFVPSLSHTQLVREEGGGGIWEAGNEAGIEANTYLKCLCATSSDATLASLSPTPTFSANEKKNLNYEHLILSVHF